MVEALAEERSPAWRILLVSFVGNNRWSGMGKWTHSIARELRSRGHQVDLWFADDFPRMYRSGRWSAVGFPPVLAWRLWKARKTYDAYVVHEPSGYWYGLLRSIFRGLPPMIAMSHGVESRRFRLLLDAAAQGFAAVPRSTRIKTPLLRLWQSDGTLRAADHVICLSELDRQYLHRRLGLPLERVSLMINGVDRVPGSRPQLRPGGKRVLFVAGWLDAKGSFTLPAIWSRVRAAHPEATLSLIGTGAGAQEVLHSFPESDRASIRVVPRLTEPEQMQAEFDAHDIFFMPSLNEGSPLALLEAMAAGLPSVAGSAGGIPDIVADGESALLFDPLDLGVGADLLVRLLGDPVLRERLAEAGRARAVELGWAQAAATLLAAIASAVGSQS